MHFLQSQERGAQWRRWITYCKFTNVPKSRQFCTRSPRMIRNVAVRKSPASLHIDCTLEVSTKSIIQESTAIYQTIRLINSRLKSRENQEKNAYHSWKSARTRRIVVKREIAKLSSRELAKRFYAKSEALRDLITGSEKWMSGDVETCSNRGYGGEEFTHECRLQKAPEGPARNLHPPYIRRVLSGSIVDVGWPIGRVCSSCHYPLPSGVGRSGVFSSNRRSLFQKPSHPLDPTPCKVYWKFQKLSFAAFTNVLEIATFVVAENGERCQCAQTCILISMKAVECSSPWIRYLEVSAIAVIVRCIVIQFLLSNPEVRFAFSLLSTWHCSWVALSMISKCFKTTISSFMQCRYLFCFQFKMEYWPPWLVQCKFT